MKYGVLVVDDEPWSRKLIISLVRWKELDLELVGEAEDTIDSLAKIRNLKPSIIITDMKMPGTNAVEYLKNIRELHPQGQLIVVSGYNEFPYLQQALRSGALDYLLKPVDPELLNTNLETCIQHLNENLAGGFSDPRKYQEYLWFRKKIHQELAELDKTALERSFALFAHHFKSRPILPKDDSLYRGMKNELVDQLLGFLDEFQVDSLLTQQIRTEWEAYDDFCPPHPQKLLADVSQTYLVGLRAVEEAQGKRKYLDPTEVARYLDNHFTEPITLEGLAKLFLVTKEHLSRSFHTRFNQTLWDYLIQQRMEYAKILLLKKGVSIKEVPLLCGYSDLPYFYRVFKKYFGTTPARLVNEENQHSPKHDVKNQHIAQPRPEG